MLLEETRCHTGFRPNSIAMGQKRAGGATLRAQDRNTWNLRKSALRLGVNCDAAF